MKKILLFLMLSICWLNTATTQERYLDPVFDEVERTPMPVTYGVNATILLVPQFGQAIPQPLMMDIYSPKDSKRTTTCSLFSHGKFFTTSTKW
jgi:hypothetical protein